MCSTGALWPLKRLVQVCVSKSHWLHCRLLLAMNTTVASSLMQTLVTKAESPGIVVTTLPVARHTMFTSSPHAQAASFFDLLTLTLPPV